MKDWMKFVVCLAGISVFGLLGLLVIVGLFFNPMAPTEPTLAMPVASAEQTAPNASAPTAAPTVTTPAAAPNATPTATPTATATPTNTRSATTTTSPYVSLNYDETNGDPLTPGQSKLIAFYLRIPAPISQASLEAAISKIQQEAAAVKATTFQGYTLTLDQRQAWLVWCSDSRQVDPPADVSLVHEVTLLSEDTFGRIWIQVPFAQGVPLRTDDTWIKCGGEFWAVAVH